MTQLWVRKKLGESRRFLCNVYRPVPWVGLFLLIFIFGSWGNSTNDERGKRRRERFWTITQIGKVLEETQLHHFITPIKMLLSSTKDKIIIFWTIKPPHWSRNYQNKEISKNLEKLKTKKVSTFKNFKMKTVGLLALGGAMGLKFEDLSYNNLRDAFSKVR